MKHFLKSEKIYCCQYNMKIEKVNEYVHNLVAEKPDINRD